MINIENWLLYGFGFCQKVYTIMTVPKIFCSRFKVKQKTFFVKRTIKNFDDMYPDNFQYLKEKQNFRPLFDCAHCYQIGSGRFQKWQHVRTVTYVEKEAYGSCAQTYNFFSKLRKIFVFLLILIQPLWIWLFFLNQTNIYSIN